MVIKILDLFCGLGGVAKGFQSYLRQRNIKFEYYAIDVDGRILLAHKILNPDSIVIRRDAYSFTDDELKQYDFIWASPPCETHSNLNLYNRKNLETFKKPDMRLWKLISRFYSLGKPFVVENVKPYYGALIKPTARVGRHFLWSNLHIKDIDFDGVKFMDIKDDVDKLMEFHEVPKKVKFVLKYSKLRDALRDMMYWKLAYSVAEQVIPQVVGKKIIQTILPI